MDAQAANQLQAKLERLIEHEMLVIATRSREGSALAHALRPFVLVDMEQFPKRLSRVLMDRLKMPDDKGKMRGARPGKAATEAR